MNDASQPGPEAKRPERLLSLPAVFMRGGTSKGVFFDARDLPAATGWRDRLLLRVMGSPDRYGKQIDGLGGASSSTSKVVLVSPSGRPGHDVDYLFGQVAIDRPFIDWSGNCGNLSAAVGPFAIASGMVAAPASGLATVRIWQANLGQTILAQVPMRAGEVNELGDFELDGVAFPAAQIRLDFLYPASSAGALLPTGQPLQLLQVPGVGAVAATCIQAGNPTVFVEAAALGLQGMELQPQVNTDARLLARAEAVRSAAAVAMGLAQPGDDVSATRPATPKLVAVAPPADYAAADGRLVAAGDIHLLARAFSMGLLHHAVPGSCAIALAAAAAVPGTLVQRLVQGRDAGPLCFGHASGRMAVDADCEWLPSGAWAVTRVSLSRSARRLMVGRVWVPPED